MVTDILFREPAVLRGLESIDIKMFGLKHSYAGSYPLFSTEAPQNGRLPIKIPFFENGLLVMDSYMYIIIIVVIIIQIIVAYI